MKLSPKILLLFVFTVPFLNGIAHAEGYTNKDGKPVLISLEPGSTQTVDFDGFKGGSVSVLVAKSTPQFLGRFLSDANGHVHAVVTLPANLEIGAHTIVATGIDPLDRPYSAEFAFEVKSDAPAGLSFTGSNSYNMLALAGVLITVGIAGTAAARKRIEAQTAREVSPGNFSA